MKEPIKVIEPVGGDLMKMEHIAQVVGPLESNVPGDVDVKSVVYDSRKVRPGSLFVAIRGDKFDGADFIDDAIQRGAVAVVTEVKGSQRSGLPVLRVEDTRRALARISDLFYGSPSKQLQVTGITGTNGKTTTAFMLYGMLKGVERRPGLIGTISYEFGDRSIPAGRTTPESTDLNALLHDMTQAGCDSVVMEVSSHALQQKRVSCIDFDYGIFTNLSEEHLDYHGNMDAYFETKRMLFHYVGANAKKGVAVVNIDDPWGVRLLNGNGFEAERISYGTVKNAAVCAERIELDEKGSRFVVRTPWGDTRIHLRMLGRFNVLNALAAITAGGHMGIDVGFMGRVLESLPPVPGRLEPIPNDRDFQIFVDFAHTPDALKNVLQMLKGIKHGRLIVVFGCGGDRDRDKRPMMGRVASELADHIILTSDNPRSEDPKGIIRQIKGGLTSRAPAEVEVDRAKAIARAVEMAEAGDMILIAGKGHENYQQFENTVVPFDDRDVVRACL